MALERVAGLRNVVPRELTYMQEVVLYYSALGYYEPQLATRIRRSEHTVHVHKRDARIRLQAATITEAVLRAERYRFITTPNYTQHEFDHLKKLDDLEHDALALVAEYDGQYSSVLDVSRKLSLPYRKTKDVLTSVDSKLKFEGRGSKARSAMMYVVYNRQ